MVGHGLCCRPLWRSRDKWAPNRMQKRRGQPMSQSVSRKPLRFFAVLPLIAVMLTSAPASADGDIIQLLPGTGILLDQSSGSGSGGNATSTSSSTNIFSPAAFVDYKRFGGEPPAVVDRYPFTSAAQCTPKPTPCFRVTVYFSAPQ